jgi:hypothetical protein
MRIEGTLRDLLEAAVAFGYHTFGVSEHAPRGAERFLYEEEQKRGWDVAVMDSPGFGEGDGSADFGSAALG